MDLRQLEYFVAVAEEANFTRAADRVHITQSGVSAQIRQFERELGADLFDRSARLVRLTPAGAAALPHARKALAAAQAIRTACDDVNGLVRGRLRIGMVTGCTVTPLFDALASFHRRHPRIEITLTEDNSDRLVEMLSDGRLDLALIGSAGEDHGQKANTVVLIDEELVAAVAPGHPLADAGPVTVSALRDVPLVSLPRGTGVRAALDAACAAAGFEPRIVFEASALPMVVQLAAQGLGLGMVPASVANAPRAGNAPVIVPIAHPPVRSRLELAWPPEPSANPAARVLIEQARALGSPGRPAS